MLLAVLSKLSVKLPRTPIGRLLLERRVLEPLIGPGKGCRTGLIGIVQVPDHATPNDRGDVHLLC
jgi:hypothetical protein